MPHVLAQDLRKAVLQAAVQGKLTERLSSDTDITISIKSSLEKKNRMIKAGEIQREKPFSKSQKYQEYPFDIPDEWIWIRFGELTINKDSKRVPVSKAEREHRAKVYDYYGASGVIDKIDDYLFNETNMLIGEDGANLLLRSTPIAFCAKGKYWVNNHAHVLNVCGDISLEYICLYINAIDLSPYVTGTAQPKMNQENMNAIWVPLPPIEEQARIVAKVDELMEKIDEYEKIENELTELQKAFPGNMKDAILQAAMQGKLTEQRKSDSTVDYSLLKTKNYSKLEDELELPESWINSHLEDITRSISTKQYQILDSEIKTTGKYPVISQSKQYSIGFSDEETKVLHPDKKLVAFGDHTTVVKTVDFPFVVGADGVKLFEATSNILPDYLYYCLTYYANEITDKGGYSRHYKFLKNKSIPLPPIEEQQRIVDKLDQLLPLCESLEAII